jgi:hypothetical protein
MELVSCPRCARWQWKAASPPDRCGNCHLPIAGQPLYVPSPDDANLIAAGQSSVEQPAPSQPGAQQPIAAPKVPIAWMFITLVLLVVVISAIVHSPADGEQCKQATYAAEHEDGSVLDAIGHCN